MRTPKLYFREKLKVSDRELVGWLETNSIDAYRVSWIGDPTANWLVMRGSIGKESAKTKSEAVKKARKMAKQDRPSLLIIERKKDSKFGQSGVADWYHYGRQR